MEKSIIPNGFFEIPHTADASLVVFGSTREELFINSAKGMYHIMGITYKDKPEKRLELELAEHDLESLLVSFLSELLYSSENLSMVRDFDLTIDNGQLSGILVAVPICDSKIEIKAITFNNLKIDQHDNIYKTQLVFDI